MILSYKVVTTTWGKNNLNQMWMSLPHNAQGDL